MRYPDNHSRASISYLDFNRPPSLFPFPFSLFPPPSSLLPLPLCRDTFCARRTVNGLAGLSHTVGALARALPLYHRALHIKKLAHGPAHPEVHAGPLEWPSNVP